MNTDGIDWVFDTSREGTIPKGRLWRWFIKRWVISGILLALASMAGVVTALVGVKDSAPEFVFAVTMAAFILVFCVFLVWMTYRRACRRNRRPDAEDMVFRHEVPQRCREKRQQRGTVTRRA